MGAARRLHPLRDELGNVVGLTDAGSCGVGVPPAHEPIPAKLVGRYDYDPYGRTYMEHRDPNGNWVRTAASRYGNPFAWTAQRYDAGVKMYGFFARTYSPELGRWLQRDPAGHVDGTNLYQYVRSMPTRFTDPLGETATSCISGGCSGQTGPTTVPPPTSDQQVPICSALQVAPPSPPTQDGKENACAKYCAGAYPGQYDACMAGCSGQVNGGYGASTCHKKYPPGSAESNACYGGATYGNGLGAIPQGPSGSPRPGPGAPPPASPPSAACIGACAGCGACLGLKSFNPGCAAMCATCLACILL